jgi:RNA polymerase sigma-70 factor (ECF subfamily)
MREVDPAASFVCMAARRYTDLAGRMLGMEELSRAARARAEVEAPIREAHVRGDLTAATTAALELYGDELYRFLVATLASETDAGDVSAELWELIWSSLPSFEWRSSFRTWAYVLGRRACLRFRRTEGARRTRRLSDTAISRIEQQLRTSVWYLRDTVRDGMSALRAQLDDDERALLYLRVDRELAWREVAALMLGGEVDAKAEAAIRRRFTRLKKRLREMAKDAGLVPED